MPAYWVIAEDPITRIALRKAHTRVVMNSGEIFDAMRAFCSSLPRDAPWPDPLPPDFPAPVLTLPDDPRPDYFEWGGMRYVSERLRRTLALPQDDASWVACEWAGAPVAKLHYWLFHPRALKSVVDLERSKVRITRHVSAKTGATVQLLDPIEALRFFDGVTAGSPVLVDRAIGDAHPLASEALAHSVVDAGCTGIVFLHPMWVIPGAIDGVVLGASGPERRIYDDEFKRIVEVQAVEPAVADLGSRPSPTV